MKWSVLFSVAAFGLAVSSPGAYARSCKEVRNLYDHALAPKAYAVSSNGMCGYWTASFQNELTLDEAKRRAVQWCESARGTNCHVVSYDGSDYREKLRASSRGGVGQQ